MSSPVVFLPAGVIATPDENRHAGRRFRTLAVHTELDPGDDDEHDEVIDSLPLSREQESP